MRASSPHSAGWIEPRDARVESDFLPAGPTRRAGGVTHASQEDMRPVAQVIAAQPDDQPALGGESGQSVDIASMLVGVIPMLRTVILDADLPLLPSHVDAANEFAEFVENDDLRLGLRKPGGDQQQARPGLLR